MPIANVHTGFSLVAKFVHVLFPVTFLNPHCQLVPTGLDVSVKLTARGELPVVAFIVNDDTGGDAVTLINVAFVKVFVPPELVDVRFTV